MPIYEYQCIKCGHQLEAFQKMSEPPLRECPKCHQETLNKLVSSTSFQLKGTGWYATDFRDKGKSKPASADEQSSGEKSSTQGEDKGQKTTDSAEKNQDKTTKKTNPKDSTAA